MKGEFYSIENGRMPTRSVRAPHPPIYAASRSDDGMDVVARECDCWFVNYDKDHRNYEQSLKLMEREIGTMQKRVAEYDRHMEYGINAVIILGETEEDAQRKAQEHLDAVSRLQVGTSGVGANLIGTRKSIVEKIKRYEAMGIGLLMLHFWPMSAGLEEFGEKIMADL